MRLFVGIGLSDAVERELASAVTRLRSSAAPAAGSLRWTEPDSWHITLQFLGTATPEQLTCLMEQLREVRSAPVAVRLGHLSCFERAGVLFSEVEATRDLAVLAGDVAAATSRCGFVAETRPFHPHITLARKTEKKGNRQQGDKNPRTASRALRSQDLRDLAASAGAYRFTRFTAQEFVLYESHLGADKARYEIRAWFPLRMPA